MRALCCLAIALTACSETGLSEVLPDPADGVEEAAGDGEHADDGGWGAWSVGSVPDLYVVMAAFGGSYARPSQVLVVDLRGRVVDRWEPPADENGLVETFVREVRYAGPGVVLVTTDSSFGWGTRFDAPPGQRPLLERGPDSEVWRGDLIAGTWERVLSTDPSVDAPVVEATGEALPEGWATDHVGRFLPLGSRSMLALATPIDCASDQPLTWASLSLDAAEQSEDLDPGELWSDDTHPALWRARGGWTEAGERTSLLGYVTRPCSEPVLHLDRWRPGLPAEPLGTLPYDQTLSGLRWHAPTGTALATAVLYDGDDGAPTGAEVRWILDGQVRTESLPDVAYVQPVAVLDPDVGAWAYTTWNSVHRRDEIVLRAGGREVWRIDEVKDGLADRGVQIFDAIVIPAP